MKKREAILDFTSLLDVTLIVLFFFVLFSHLDSEENKARVDAKINELEMAVQEAEVRENDAIELNERLEKALQIVNDSDERNAGDIKEIIEFNQSGNIKLLLKSIEGNWILQVIRKDEIIENIELKELSGETLLKAIRKLGYQKKDTIFCDLIFDGKMRGSYSAYKAVTDVLDKEIKKEYAFFYFSYTDLSVGS